MKTNNDFRFDLQLGKVAEDKVADLFTNKKIEVKRDFKTQQTGNVFVEYQSRGKNSGISTTESDYYAFVISHDQIIFIKTKKLKEICRKYLGTPYDIKGGDKNSSRGILLSTDELING